MSSPKIKIQLQQPIPPPPPPPTYYQGTAYQNKDNVPPPPPASGPSNIKVLKVPQSPPPPPDIQLLAPPVPLDLLPPPDNKSPEAAPSPLEKLFSNPLKDQVNPVLNSDALNDAHKFDDLMNAQFMPTNLPLNSISALLLNNGQNKKQFNFTPGMFSALDKLTIAAPQDAAEEIEIQTSAQLSFTPACSITFSRATYPTLQHCIDAAPDKTFIIVPSGIYPERLSIKKKVVLEGTGSVSICGADISDNCTFSKIQFQCDNKGKGGDVAISGNSIVNFTNVSFLTNEINALSMKDVAIVTLNDCRITSLQLPCVFLNSKASMMAVNTNFEGSQSYGIILADESTATFENCSIRRNGKAAVCTNGTSAVNMNNSFVEFNYDGFELNSPGAVNIENSSISFSTNYGFIVKCRSFVQCRKCTFDSNKEGTTLAYNDGIFFSFDSTYKGTPEKPIIYLAEKGNFSSANDNFSGKCLSAIAAASSSEVYCENSIFNLQGSGIIAAQSTVNAKGITLSATTMAIQLISSFVDLKTSKFASEGTTISLAGIRGTIQDCEFTGKTIGSEINNVEVKVINSSFIGYKVAASIQTGTLVFEKTSFKNNQTGIENASGCLTFAECVFATNETHIAQKGGDIKAGKTRFIEAQQFAISMTGGKAALSDCEISKNKSGVDIGRSDLFVERSFINDNGMFGIQVRSKSSLIAQSTKFGGQYKSITFMSSRAVISDCSFEQASASHIEIIRSNVNIDKSEICSTPSALLVAENSNLSLTNSTVKGCDKGISIKGENASATVTTVHFEETSKPFDGEVNLIKHSGITGM